jgi:hypothetical protein
VPEFNDAEVVAIAHVEYKRTESRDGEGAFLELRATAVDDALSILIPLSEALQCLLNLVDLCVVYFWVRELPESDPSSSQRVLTFHVLRANSLQRA